MGRPTVNGKTVLFKIDTALYWKVIEYMGRQRGRFLNPVATLEHLVRVGLEHENKNYPVDVNE